MDTTKRRGKCINFGNCAKAARQEVIELDFTEDFLCPECEQDLVEEKASSPPPLKLIAVIVGILAVLGSGAAYLFFGKSSLKEIHLTPSQLELTVGDRDTLTYTVKPDGAQTEKLVWNSSDKRIAGVNKGVVTAKSAGEVQITVSTPDKKISAQCTVTVGERKTGVLPPPADTVIPPPEESNRKENTKEETGTPQTPSAPKAPVTSHGSIAVPGGTYTGDLKNGKPHGKGTLRYSSRTQIHPNDLENRYAEAGESVEGDFYEGLFDKGSWRRSNGKTEKLVFGRR
jgi:hypothetical protein